MNELKRNGSGYYDDTAYKAMKNYQEEKEMFENSKEVREGEIWLIETKRGYEEVLILAANERTSFVCLLKDQSFGAGYIEVPSVSLKYTRLDMVVYKLNTQFVEYVKTVNSKRFLEIIEEFKKYLWFCDGDKCSLDVDNSETEKSMKEELEKVTASHSLPIQPMTAPIAF